jgi:hypothetical protein
MFVIFVIVPGEDLAFIMAGCTEDVESRSGFITGITFHIHGSVNDLLGTLTAVFSVLERDFGCGCLFGVLRGHGGGVCDSWTDEGVSLRETLDCRFDGGEGLSRQP